MMMNRDISTPLDVAAQMSSKLAEFGALAVIEGPHETKNHEFFHQSKENNTENQEEKNLEFIDMRQPISESCKMQILTHKIHRDAPQRYFDEVNKAYWRTCSFFLSYVIRRAFSTDVTVTDVRILSTKVSDGFFAVEFDLEPNESTENWSPSELDLLNFTKSARNFLVEQPEFSIVGKNSYSIGGDIAEFDGPLIASLDLIGPFAVTNCARTGPYTFTVNGTSIAKEFAMNHALFGLLEQKARNNNLKQYSRILSNESKRKTFTYKQWTDEYLVDKTSKVDLSDGHEKIAEAEKNVRDSMEPQPYHSLNQQYREYRVGRERVSHPIKISERQAWKLKDIFKNGKFEKSVYIDKEFQ